MHTNSTAFEPDTAVIRQRVWQVLALLTILLAAGWAFRPALSGPFIFDDFPNLENMRHLNDGVSSVSLRHYLASVRGYPGRPLAMLSFLIEDAAWPAYPADYKRNNLLFHLLAGLLVYWLALKFAVLTALPDSARRWAPLACTAAWLLNPMQLSATMLVVQRMNILASIFVIAGLIVYLKVVLSQRASPLARVALAGSCLAVFGGLAFLCKENGILIFAFATALNLTLLDERIQAYPALTRRILLVGAAMPVLALVIAAASAPDALLGVYKIREFTLVERVLTQPRVLFDYLGNILIPRLGSQGILHDDYQFSRGLFDPPATLASIVLLAAIVFLAVRFRRRATLFSFAVIWFLAGHLMESTVVGLELYFEHRNYVPMIGPLFAVCAFALRQPRPKLAWASALVLVWLLGFLALTRLNAHTWGSRGQQAMVWLQEHPRSGRAVQWAASFWLDAGEPERAREILQQGIERMPQSSDLRLQMVLLDCFTRGVRPGQWEDSLEMLRHSRYSHLSPLLISTYVVQLRSGSRCRGTLDRGMVFELAEAMIANPAYQQVPDSLSHVHYQLAQLFHDSRQLDRAMHELDLAWELNPFPSIPREQAIHLLTAGLPEEALKYIDRSNNTPVPWFKRILLDVPSLNSGLEASAHAMIAAKARENPPVANPPSDAVPPPAPSANF